MTKFSKKLRSEGDALSIETTTKILNRYLYDAIDQKVDIENLNIFRQKFEQSRAALEKAENN